MALSLTLRSLRVSLSQTRSMLAYLCNKLEMVNNSSRTHCERITDSIYAHASMTCGAEWRQTRAATDTAAGRTGIATDGLKIAALTHASCCLHVFLNIFCSDNAITKSV